MLDFLFLFVVLCILWIAWRSFKQEPILPTLKFLKKESNNNQTKTYSKTKGLIKDFLGIEDIKYNMIHLPKNTYVMAIKCRPVNYHLRNALEQEGIDVRFEQWLTSLDYEFIMHLQSRRVDFQQQYNEYVENVQNDIYLNDNAKNYCYMTMQYMERWLSSQPRFETVRFVLFPIKIATNKTRKRKNIDEWERALRELTRRASSAVNYLESCGVHSSICTTEDLAEMLYYSLNRKRTNKARFKDVRLQEMLAYYCTSEQDSIRIKKVMDDVLQKEKEAVAQ